MALRVLPSDIAELSDLNCLKNARMRGTRLTTLVVDVIRV